MLRGLVLATIAIVSMSINVFADCGLAPGGQVPPHEHDTDKIDKTKYRSGNIGQIYMILKNGGNQIRLKNDGGAYSSCWVQSKSAVSSTLQNVEDR